MNEPLATVYLQDCALTEYAYILFSLTEPLVVLVESWVLAMIEIYSSMGQV
jgi:hypothetical protein